MIHYKMTAICSIFLTISIQAMDEDIPKEEQKPKQVSIFQETDFLENTKNIASGTFNLVPYVAGYYWLNAIRKEVPHFNRNATAIILVAEAIGLSPIKRLVLTPAIDGINVLSGLYGIGSDLFKVVQRLSERYQDDEEDCSLFGAMLQFTSGMK